jgi:hypothetical protein
VRQPAQEVELLRPAVDVLELVDGRDLVIR